MADNKNALMTPELRTTLDVIKRTVYGGGDLTDEELLVYNECCKQAGVHPLARGVHIWKDRAGRIGLAVSVHALTASATKDRQAGFNGYEWEYLDPDPKKPAETEEERIASCTCVGEVWDPMTQTWKEKKATIRRSDVFHLLSDGKKDNWKNSPRTMWENRARAKWCREHRADVCGPLYLVDEVEDVQPHLTPGGASEKAASAVRAALEARTTTTQAPARAEGEPDPKILREKVTTVIREQRLTVRQVKAAFAEAEVVYDLDSLTSDGVAKVVPILMRIGRGEAAPAATGEAAQATAGDDAAKAEGATGEQPKRMREPGED